MICCPCSGNITFPALIIHLPKFIQLLLLLMTFIAWASLLQKKLFQTWHAPMSSNCFRILIISGFLNIVLYCVMTFFTDRLTVMPLYVAVSSDSNFVMNSWCHSVPRKNTSQFCIKLVQTINVKTIFNQFVFLRPAKCLLIMPKFGILTVLFYQKFNPKLFLINIFNRY